jgi:hypothetical protein
MSMPSTSRRPSPLTPMATDTMRLLGRPSQGSVEPDVGPLALDGLRGVNRSTESNPNGHTVLRDQERVQSESRS